MSLSSTWIEQIHSLPVLPQVAMRITERMQSPTATVDEIAGLIKSDVGLTAKVLRLGNSSYYSIPGGVTDVNKALQYLGFNTVAQLVLTASVFGAFKSQGVNDFSLSAFWTHSFAVGLLSEITARNLQAKNPSDLFVGGLMHDMGKLILLELAPEQMSKAVKHARENKINFIEAEIALGQPTHVQLGVELAKYWRLPAAAVSGIQHHHDQDPNKTPHDGAIVAWANLWVNAQKVGHSGNYSSSMEKAQLLEATFENKIGIGANGKNKIAEVFYKEFEKAGSILNG